MSHYSKGISFGILSGLFWGLDAVLLGSVLDRASALAVWSSAMVLALAVTALHDACSAAWLWLVAIARRQVSTYRRQLSARDLRIMLAASLCGGPVGMSCYVLAIERMGAAHTAVVSALYPALGVWLAVLFGRDRFRRHMGLGTLLVVGATMLLSGGADGEWNMYGLALGVLCAIGWGAECVWCSYGFAKELDPALALLMRQSISALFYMAVVLPLFGAWYTECLLWLDWRWWAWIAMTAAVGTLSYTFYYRAIHSLGPIRGMGLNISYTAWAVFFSAVFLGEWPTWFTILAALGVMLGSMWTVAPISEWYRQWRSR